MNHDIEESSIMTAFLYEKSSKKVLADIQFKIDISIQYD